MQSGFLLFRINPETVNTFWHLVWFIQPGFGLSWGLYLHMTTQNILTRIPIHAWMRFELMIPMSKRPRFTFFLSIFEYVATWPCVLHYPHSLQVACIFIFIRCDLMLGADIWILTQWTDYKNIQGMLITIHLRTFYLTVSYIKCKY